MVKGTKIGANTLVEYVVRKADSHKVRLLTAKAPDALSLMESCDVMANNIDKEK